MKKLLLIIATGLLGVTAIAQQTGSDEPYLTKLFANSSFNSIDIKTSGGSIMVQGGNASEARVEVYVRANNSAEKISKEEIEKRLEQYTLDVAVVDKKLMAMAKPKERNMNWKKSVSISFKVYSPVNISVDLATSGGSIKLGNLSGALEFTTGGGSLSLESLSGNVKGRTSGGSINVLACKDNIDLSTSGGSIKAAGCTGKIRLTTSGGSLSLSDLNGSITATTSGGSINASDISGELVSRTSGGSIFMKDMMCSLETSTSGGQITVSVKQLGKYLTIRNSGGNINLELPNNKGLNMDISARKVNAGSISGFNGSMSDDEMKGTLNGGGIPVTVHAGSGRINLTMK